MAYDRSTVRDAVTNRLANSDFPTAVLNQFINDANRQIVNRHLWPFMEGSANIAVAQSDNAYDLPTGAQRPLTLRITTPAAAVKDITDDYIDYQEFDRRYPDPAADSENRPRVWTYVGEELLLYPVPDQAYTLAMRYTKKPTDIAADGTVPDIPEEWQEVLILNVYKRALEYMDQIAQSQVVERSYEELLNDMVIRLVSKQYGKPTKMRDGNRRRFDRGFDRDY